jgi:hypothetical protein
MQALDASPVERASRDGSVDAGMDYLQL